ncbi:helix-turn-helix domain-containing protein [Polyangium aurulentum]|uniref:helix-turn-helix domain-containing protein n=1 Tax=Polyangium aurulentum TaxID=2567896 RepID=UPI0010ADDB69|nr:helix-turn-helix transcriptional regulator [Polyangium aurulentum]UQA57062.1 helix-turn-helix domain-containing protein [Polyangium aurulentum]
MPRRTTPESTCLKLGARVAALRQQRGLSMKKLAVASQQSPGHLSNIERGLVNVTVGTLVRLAKALKTTPVHILSAAGDSELERFVEELSALPLKAQRKLAAKLSRTLHARPQGASAEKPGPIADVAPEVSARLDRARDDVGTTER